MLQASTPLNLRLMVVLCPLFCHLGAKRIEARAESAPRRGLLEAADTALNSEDVARALRGRLTFRRQRVQEVLAIMADLGIARLGTERSLYAARR